MAYRLVAADLDGTLRPEYRPITPGVRDAVRRAQAAGVYVVMATGRSWLTAESFVRDLELREAIICSNGGTIHESTSGATLFERRVPVELARRVIAATAEDVTVLACLDDGFYTRRLTGDALGFVGTYAAEHLHCVPDLAETLTIGPQKLVFVNPVDVTSRLFAELTAEFGAHLQVVQSFERYVELTHPGVSKGKAVEWLAARWGIPREQVIAIGDQNNDGSMIEWAGLGVAMGNAVDSIKAVADFIAPTADEDGVAAVIERFVLSN